MKIENIKKDVELAQKIKCGKYIFHKYSFGEEGTYLRAEVIEEIKEGLINLAKEFNPDYIVSTEPGSYSWGLLVSSMLGKPLNIIRASNPKLTNKSIKLQRTGYCVRGLNFNNFNSGDIVVIVEDIIATGATTELIIDTLNASGVKVLGVLSILRKGLDRLSKKYDIPIKSLINLKEL